MDLGGSSSSTTLREHAAVAQHGRPASLLDA